MIFTRLIGIRCYTRIRSYCQKERTGLCPPNQFCRKGDQGETHTHQGDVQPKDHEIFEVLGTTEELLCFLGIAKEHAREANHIYVDKLKRIQTLVIEIQTCLMKYKDNSEKNITHLHIKELEDWTKTYERELPPPENYIIPGGGLTAASLHLSRAACRKAERRVIPFVRRGEISQPVQVYLNRLSDFLLILSRIAAKLDKQNEHIYVPIEGGKQKNKNNP
ncbi:corrinoid adenosyltransferase [Holotrichia oblita]|uniref:Corrinoid adenosyltransferase n=2 Tax=Holotrichia oblita TaxID=644536 RepID=A0ACB9T232_HOLOL|nr:corrinoid adenosyltransferase [Holotrichia oblita]KAI4460877.1 corrinoid adenosyltransferase [Holotrichia oblita]